MGCPKDWVSSGAFLLMGFQLPELGGIDILFLKLPGLLWCQSNSAYLRLSQTVRMPERPAEEVYKNRTRNECQLHGFHNQFFPLSKVSAKFHCILKGIRSLEHLPSH